MNELISMESFLNFLAYVGTGFALMIFGVIIFAFTTKFSERELIKEGNVAVALKLWGKALGLAIVLYSVWSNSVNLMDAVVWGVIGIITQVVAYLIIEFVLTPKTNLAKKVEEGNVAVGLSLFCSAIVVGLVVAASLTY